MFMTNDFLQQIDIIEVLGVIAGFFIIERVGRKSLILWCSLVEIISMLIIGGLASGPTIAPTVPPEKYGQAAIAFIVSILIQFNLIVLNGLTSMHSAYTSSHSICLGVLWRGQWLPKCASAPTGRRSWVSGQPHSGVCHFTLFSEDVKNADIGNFSCRMGGYVYSSLSL